MTPKAPGPGGPRRPSRAPATGDEADPPRVVRPSLRAAASSFAKVAGVLAVAFLMPFVVAVLAGGGPAFVTAFLLGQFGLGWAVPAALGVLVPAVRLTATRYELDDEGVRVHSSILSRSDQRVPWDKVTLLVQQRSLADRALGIERLTIVAYGVRGATLHLVGLRDAAPLRDFAARRMQASASVAALFRND